MLLYYQILLLTSFVFAIFLKNRALTLIIPLLLCFVIVGFRDVGIGKDDLDYLDFFIRSENYFDFNHVFSGEFEPLFSAIVVIAVKVFEPEKVFILITFIALGLVTYCYQRIDKVNYNLFVFYYLLTAIYWVGFHHIRFGIALPLYILSLHYVSESKIKAISIYAASLLMHYSSILMFPVFFYKYLRKSWVIPGILLSYCLWFFDVFKSLVTIIVGFGVLPSRTLELFYSDHVFSISPFQLGFVKMVAISVLSIYLYNGNYEKYIKSYSIVTMISISFSNMAIFSNRVAAFNMALEPIVMFSIFESFLKKRRSVTYIYFIPPFLYGVYLIYSVNVVSFSLELS